MIIPQTPLLQTRDRQDRITSCDGKPVKKWKNIIDPYCPIILVNFINPRSD
jgi:hypothetical protein